MRGGRTISQRVADHGLPTCPLIAALLLATLTTSSSGIANARRPTKERARFYLEVRSVREATKNGCNLKKHAAAVLSRELARYPSVVTQLGPKRLVGDALAAELKARKLTGYGIVLRITRCAHALLPPRPGGVYKTLMVEVRTAVDAEKIPSGQMALAGDGRAEVGTEVTRVKPSELAALQREALTEAVRESTEKLVKRLSGNSRKSRRRRGKVTPR